jgi:hypothetical protein
MYLIEGAANPNPGTLPQAMYWAITTSRPSAMATTPVTALGKIVTGITMIMGLGSALPVGIVATTVNEIHRRDFVVT